MTTSDAKTTRFSSAEEHFPLHFSEWLKCRRQQLDLTQEQLAQRASCSVFAIRKIESGERQPSTQLARTLGGALEIPVEYHDTFIRVARGELGVERLSIPAGASSAGSIAIPVNLPRSLTPFIGREPELTALGRFLCDPQCSLLTIVGPGGIGKTRLAIEAADQSKDRFPNGVWFVPLAALNSPALLISAIADAMQFGLQGTAPPQTQLLRYLCEKRSLIVLDNAEHLLEGVDLFTQILNACPQVKLLVTSRERLSLLSEWVFEITGLPVPPDDRVEQFESYSSVALFLQSARRLCPGFRLDETNRAAIADICRLVEGMPLAIELAATWMPTLSLSEIEQEIRRSLDFLSTAMRDLPERHRSMRAVFEHSWRLLNEQEQQALCRLSVFRGGFTREAAEQVAGASLPILMSLLSKSLLLRREDGRYDLHELIRQCALEKLHNNGHSEETCHKHLDYFVSMVVDAHQGMRSALLANWLKRIEQEHDNIRAALAWAFSPTAPS
ncbi:MAG TPA: helix-turn-helix domain-containing protein, partial [Candidatus Paceibacterota bacterium]